MRGFLQQKPEKRATSDKTQPLPNGSFKKKRLKNDLYALILAIMNFFVKFQWSVLEVQSERYRCFHLEQQVDSNFYLRDFVCDQENSR